MRRDAPSASLTAATIRSWSISTSDGSTTDGSIETETSSCLPVTTALTTPPPADPSTWASRSSPSMRCISCCICWAIRCRLPIPMVRTSCRRRAVRLVWRNAAAVAHIVGRVMSERDVGSRHLAHVDEVLREDPPRLADQVGGLADQNRGTVLEVRRDAPNVHRPAEDTADAVLEDRPPALERVPEECL